MQLPRWLIISLLTVAILFFLAAPVWWWVKRPELCATELISNLETGSYANLDRYVDENDRWLVILLAASDLAVQPRSYSDILAGRCRFPTLVLSLGETNFSADLWVEGGRLRRSTRPLATKKTSPRSFASWDASPAGEYVALERRLMAPRSCLRRLVSATPDDEALCQTLYHNLLGRNPSRTELDEVTNSLRTWPDRLQAAVYVVWKVASDAEFKSRHTK